MKAVKVWVSRDVGEWSYFVDLWNKKPSLNEKGEFYIDNFSDHYLGEVAEIADMLKEGEAREFRLVPVSKKKGGGR